MQCYFSFRLLSGTAEEHLFYHLNSDNATAIHGLASKKEKLSVLSGWEGCHTLYAITHSNLCVSALIHAQREE